jgi:GlpG protein
MRLVVTLDNVEKAEKFSLFLLEKGIENQFEVKGQNQFTVWVFEEDDATKAQSALEEFDKNPNWTPSQETIQKKREEALQQEIEKTMAQTPANQMNAEGLEEKGSSLDSENLEENNPQTVERRPSPFGKVTLMVMLTCIMLFLWASFSAPGKAKMPGEGVSSSLLFTPPYSDLIYENPLAYQYAETFFENQRNSENPEEYLKTNAAYEEVYRVQSTPYWHGYYETFLLPESSVNYSLNKMFSVSPQFEQIAEGQVWRIVTPALLHANLFHILFNLLWFAFLGKQIEQRIGFWRYSLFILLVAALSNTAQYLMSGPSFLGLSGVVMGMAGFIWMRQTRAAWEGYTIQKPTLYFLGFYVLVLVALQTASLVMEMNGAKGIAPNIANTAHIVGACIGIVLGRLNFMSAWHLGKIKK